MKNSKFQIITAILLQSGDTILILTGPAQLLIGWTGVPEMVLFSDAQEISCEKGSLKSANLRGICLPWGKIR